MSYNSKYTGAEVEQLLEKIGMKLSGKINLTSIDEIKAAQSALSQTNEVAFYLVADSSGKIPSSQSCYNIPSDIVKQLSLTSPDSVTNAALALATSTVNISAVGVNVGDLVALTRVKVKVSDLSSALGITLSLPGEIEMYQYKVLSMNDAKPTNHIQASAGVMGLMSPWDKGQVNKISGIETTANNALPKSSRFPSIPAWLVDVNTCFSVGVYPACSSQLNSPFTNSTYFTCIVQSTSTADAGGFDTIEQTAYGREGDTGLIYKRIIFKSSNDTQFGKWIKVSDVGTVPTSHVIILPSAGMVEIIDISSSIGYSTIVTNEDESEFHIAPSYFSDGVILVCDIDYSYLIAIDTDDEGNLIGTIIEKEPTKSQVYATKDEVASAISKAITTTLNTEV